MNKRSHRAKKHLGQHFLSNKKILEEIVRVAELSPKDTVLEVGPGLGSLTEMLAQKAKRVVAIEKDRDLIPILQKKFKNDKNVEIVEGDVLKITWKGKYKIVANLPYYITSRFLRLFLSNPQSRPALLVLMVQREIAERILAKNGKESLLSISVKAYAKPELIRHISKNNFSPPPKVDSAIIKLTPNKLTDNTLLKIMGAREVTQTEQILSFARAAFQQKRKMLRHSIGKSVNLPPKYENMRPEDLSLDDWARIFLYSQP